MSLAFASGHWHRVAGLRPRLGPQVRVVRQVMRGVVGYVVEDRASSRHQRLNAAAWRIVRRLDGRRSLQDIWGEIAADPREDTPTQAEIIELLGRLNAADLLRTDAHPDVAELLERHRRQLRQRRLSRFGNPLAIKMPLWDPDAFLSWLDGTLRRVPRLTVRLAALSLLAAVVLLVPAQWAGLTGNLGERVLAFDNLVVLAIVFPLLKAIHELAHGLAVKRRGGEVHEMGLMLLVFYPVPYVDASAASAFPARRDRIAVAAAGMAAELWVAALAFVLWVLLEPGPVRAVTYNAIVLGSVTTLMFNANPLLRFDGYYILVDWAGVPNLAQRANAFWQFLIGRIGLGARGLRAAAASPYERLWFLSYAPLALVYRLSVTFGIAWFVAQHYWLIGVLIAGWAIATSVLWPLGKGAAAILRAPHYASRPVRTWGSLVGTSAALVLLVWVLPLPHHTRVQGVVWLPEQAILRSEADGFVSEMPGRDGSTLAPHDAVVVLSDPEIAARLLEQGARVELARARLDAAWSSGPAAAAREQESLAQQVAAMNRLEERLALTTVRAPSAGLLKLDGAQDLPGRFIRRGDVLGHVVGAQAAPLVKVVVDQDEASFVRGEVRSVSIRLVHDFGAPLAGRLVRDTPKASHDLPSAALGTAGGGPHVADPRDERGTTAMQSLVHFDVELTDGVQPSSLGARAFVAFEHAPEPIGWRGWRLARRLFLAHFHV